MKNRSYIYALLALVVISCHNQKATNTVASVPTIQVAQKIIKPSSPSAITRNIIEDKNGDMWMATFDGVYTCDGARFENVSRDVTPARFFALFEDSSGTIWFGSVGSGVYVYRDGVFQKFCESDGYVSEEVVSIYEDRKGRMWFGGNKGATVYDGLQFQSFILSGDSVVVGRRGDRFLEYERSPFIEVNGIIEDQSGRMWFATRGRTFIYNQKTFTTQMHGDRPFSNVRSIIEDRSGHIWLGGADGLWWHDGEIYHLVSKTFTGSIYEDMKGNIWTTSESATDGSWVLTRYDVASLYAEKPVSNEVRLGTMDDTVMKFGITQATDGSIWFGDLNGVHRYASDTVTSFVRE